MGIREMINAKSSLFLPVGIGLLILAIIVNIIIFKRVFGTPQSPIAGDVPQKFYYSDDDGATWFLDSAAKIPPFDHNGKTAVRAIVSRCKDGKVMVTKLLRYSDAGVEHIDDLIKNGTEPVVAQLMSEETYAEFKRPGADWVELRLPPTIDHTKPFTAPPPHPAAPEPAPCSDGSVPVLVSPSEDVKPQ